MVSTMSSPVRKKFKSADEGFRPSGLFKTTGDDFVLRELSYFKDKRTTNDEIHDSIDLCPVSTALIDTEVFQRLRNINQLGNAQYIYTCANHNRFQHSLGVSYLAEKMCKKIKEEQPLLGASDKDVLCVKLAGLLHDLGHGPYSHLYEAFRDNYLPKYLDANPTLKKEYEDCKHLRTIPHWSHEQSSLLFIDSMLEELGLKIDLNNLDKPLRQINSGIDANSMRVFRPLAVEDGVLTSRDFLFIKECILGGPLEGFDYFVGRQDKKLEWLYDIVSNRHNGLDVDKIDYFARDHTRAIGKRGIDMKMINDARIAKGFISRPEKGQTRIMKDQPEMHYMICYPDKHVAEVMKFFQLRHYLHHHVYQHKTNLAVENMICDILCYADPYLRVKSIDGEEFPISRAYLKSDFLVRLDDTILTLIVHSIGDSRLAEARKLCQRLRRHDFYKCPVNQPLTIDLPIDDIDDLEGAELKRAQEVQRDIIIWDMSETEIEKAMLDQSKRSDVFEKLEAKDFIVKKYCYHHGAKSKNPMTRMRFFDKMSGEKLFGLAEQLPISKEADMSKYASVIPHSFQNVGIRVLVRDDRKRDAAILGFNTWMLHLEMEIKNGDTSSNKHVQSTIFDNEDVNIGDDENNDDEWLRRGTESHPAMLSQDFEDSEDENETDVTSMSQPDLSPIPVRTRSR